MTFDTVLFSVCVGDVVVAVATGLVLFPIYYYILSRLV